MRWERSGNSLATTAEKQSLIAVILLTSGHLLKVRGITLFSIDALAEIGRLREAAVTKMGGVSSGIGFIGSPGWAIGGGIALGLLERAISSSAKKEGLALAKEVERKTLSLTQNGVTFPVSAIENKDQPNPGMWSAETKQERTVDYASFSRSDKSQFLLAYNLDKGDVVDGTVTVTDRRSYVHDGSEFVAVETEVGSLKIRWQHVTSYSIVPGEPEKPQTGL